MKVNNAIQNRIKEIVANGKTKENEFLFYGFRFKDITFNMTMSVGAEKLLEQAFKELGLSENQLDFIERCALSIMELDNKKIVEVEHIAEAIQYGTEYHLKDYMKSYLNNIVK